MAHAQTHRDLMLKLRWVKGLTHTHTQGLDPLINTRGLPCIQMKVWPCSSIPVLQALGWWSRTAPPQRGRLVFSASSQVQCSSLWLAWSTCDLPQPIRPINSLILSLKYFVLLFLFTRMGYRWRSGQGWGPPAPSRGSGMTPLGIMCFS